MPGERDEHQASSAARTIGRYEVRGELGRGMMGVVYEAHDPSLGRTIALKTIHLGFAVSEEARKEFEERFLTEARAAARLSHPGIVVVHDVGQDAASGTLYIALEHLPGSTIGDLVASGRPMPWREALRVVQRVAEALHHAHERGVVHRDVKPANIMILPNGAPKIMDFGIAKVEASQLTAAGQFFGTPLYMSPEQAQGGAIDARSDLFSLGSVAYALLTGRHAFAGSGLPHIISQVTGVDPPPPSRIVSGIPPAVDSLIARALAKDPAHRYQDGQAMEEDAEDALAGRPLRHAGREDELEAELALLVDEPTATRAAARPAMARPPAPPSGRRPLAGPAIVAALVVAALTGGILLGRSRSPRAASTPPRAVDATGRGLTGPGDAAPLSAGAEPAPDTPARLAVDFEHSLRRGTLRIWLDDVLILEEPLQGLVTRKLASVRLRKGRLEEEVEVTPGRHEIRVQVAWDGEVKTESIFANFEPGASRRLAARFSGLGGLGVKRKLSLEWE